MLQDMVNEVVDAERTQVVWVLETWSGYANECETTIESVHATKASAFIALRAWIENEKNSWDEKDQESLDEFDLALLKLEANPRTPVEFPNGLEVWIACYQIT